jgi:hypothetical protein
MDGDGRLLAKHAVGAEAGTDAAVELLLEDAHPRSAIEGSDVESVARLQTDDARVDGNLALHVGCDQAAEASVAHGGVQLCERAGWCRERHLESSRWRPRRCEGPGRSVDGRADPPRAPSSVLTLRHGLDCNSRSPSARVETLNASATFGPVDDDVWHWMGKQSPRAPAVPVMATPPTAVDGPTVMVWVGPPVRVQRCPGSLVRIACHSRVTG